MPYCKLPQVMDMLVVSLRLDDLCVYSGYPCQQCSNLSRWCSIMSEVMYLGRCSAEILKRTSIACNYCLSGRCSAGLAAHFINPVKDSNECDIHEDVASECFGANKLVALVFDAHR